MRLGGNQQLCGLGHLMGSSAGGKVVSGCPGRLSSRLAMRPCAGQGFHVEQPATLAGQVLVLIGVSSPVLPFASLSVLTHDARREEAGSASCAGLSLRRTTRQCN